MTVICNFNLFDLHQEIYIIDDNGNRKSTTISALSHLGSDIASVCEMNNIQNIHLFGNEKFAKSNIIPEIKSRNLKFSELRIEVN